MSTDYRKSLISRHYGTHPSRIDVRQEIEDFLIGTDLKPARGQQAIAWVADPLTRLSTFKNTALHYPETKVTGDVLMSGFAHTEIETRIWLGFTGGPEEATALRAIAPNTVFIYCLYNLFSSIRVAELSEVWTYELDDDGEPRERNGVKIRDVRWCVQQAIPFRELNGRTEYWRLAAERQAI